MKYVSFDIKNNKKIITIDFNSLFGKDNLEHMSDFTINKRAYYGIIDFIVQDLELILGMDNQFKYNYLSAEFDILSNGDNINNFYKILKGMIENDLLIEKVSKYVENTYTVDLDEKSTGVKINSELQITDDTNKVYLKSAMIMRYMIPLICIYPGKEKLDSFIFNLFISIIKKFGEEKAVNKLYKITYSRVINTIYSDIVIWTYLKNMSKDYFIVSSDIFKSIVCSIIPKIKNNTSSISYLDVVVKEKLNHIFTFNYTLSYKSIKVNTNSSKLEEKEKMEYSLLKQDEGSLILHQADIRRKCDKYIREYNINQDDINRMKEIYNGAQHALIKLYFFNYKTVLADKEAQLPVLALGMINDLKYKYGFKTLPLLLSSKVSDERRITKRKINERIISSDKYRMIERYYVPVLNIFERMNPVITLLTIRNNKFINDNNEEISYSFDELSDEILDFIRLL